MRLALLCSLFSVSFASLEPDFGQFLSDKYGDGMYKDLNRFDQNKGNAIGSFGGVKIQSQYRPVVFIHGLRNQAGDFWKHRIIFTENGFPHGRLLATTYGPGVIGAFEALGVTLKCSYVKQIRSMFLAVSDFYNTTIDVVAISMGSPISRKAILGGICVDTKEDLGPPLTDKITTFLSVAGANHGSYLCNLPFPGVCNLKDGLTCASEFLRNINSRNGYEGKHIYALASTTDEIIGLYTICGKKSFEMGAYQEFLRHGLTHQQTISNTIQQQADIIKRHNPGS